MLDKRFIEDDISMAWKIFEATGNISAYLLYCNVGANNPEYKFSLRKECHRADNDQWSCDMGKSFK